MLNAWSLIQLYGLSPHPEGGWYKETYRSGESVEKENLPERFNGSRSISTAIYFLLEKEKFSAFHKIKSDECWHFYAGGPLHIFMIHQDGVLEIIKLGNDITKGELFQYIVPANTWFACKPAPETVFSFAGCTVAPGFDFEDFFLAEAKELCREFPQYENLIKELCRL